jgi:HSP20 family protein
LTRRPKLFRRARTIATAWAPRIDVAERNGQFIVHAELPGMNKDDVKVAINDSFLTIEGERKNEKKEEREGVYYNECRYGSFYRTIPLPEGTDCSKATAEFRNGVLEVTMPALPCPEPKQRRLEVREGK